MFLLVCLILSSSYCAQSGKVGELSSRKHGVSGSLYFLDHKRLKIVDFSYDGKRDWSHVLGKI